MNEQELKEAKERIQKKQEKLENRRVYQANLAAGREFVHKNKLKLWKVKFDNVIVSYVIVFNISANRIEIAWCLCSPRDTYSAKIARGIVGMRLMNNDRNWMYVLPNSKLSVGQVQIAFEAALLLDSFNPESLVPHRLRRAILRETKNFKH